jgi:acyl-CoA thioester hydrolase
MEHTYKHCTPIQIRFVDIDKLGHVNNATFLSYFETARVAYFQQLFGDIIDWVKTGMIIAKTTIEYKVPVFLEDDIYVYTKITRFGGKSFDISNYLMKKHGNSHVFCCEATSTLVCVNYDTKETVLVPEEWKKRVENFER